MDMSEKNLCLFRQMQVAFFSEAESVPDSDIVRAVDTPTEFACKVGGCAITGQHLIDYMHDFWSPNPREKIEPVVSPSCGILESYDVDEAIARILEETPPDGAGGGEEI